tara:strand:+ start:234 stop:1253 length:1020 start_codon:yes stop_codon:yes gene_type:complete
MNKVSPEENKEIISYHTLIDFLDGTTTDSLQEEIGTIDDRDQIYSRELNDGLSLLFYSNKNAAFDFEIPVDTSAKNPLYFFYSMSGSFTLTVSNTGVGHKIKSFQALIVNSSRKESFNVCMTANSPSKIFVIRIDREQYFGNNRNKFASRPILDSFLSDCGASSTYFHSCTPNLFIADLISKLNSYSNGKLIEPLIVEGQVKLIMGNIIKQFIEDKEKLPSSTKLTDEELSRVQKTAQEIQKNPEVNYSIQLLTAKTGLNAFKLQEAFKFLYDRTAGDYIRNARLERAEVLLKSNNYNVSEVVFYVGLSSKSYFTKIFKEKYKCCPKEYQESILNMHVG